MHPGRTCIDCHSKSNEAPSLTIAGTVYPTAHEPDECYGVPDPNSVTVEITDANNQVIMIPLASGVNFLGPQSGNFLRRTSEGSVKFPIHARLISGGKSRKMIGEVSSGDCNSCHTQNGDNPGDPQNLAPGRLLAP
jgi:hypothetical protein